MTRRPTYASEAVIRRAVETARKLGFDVAGFELLPGGGVKIIDRAAIGAAPKDEFEQWDQAGKLG